MNLAAVQSQFDYSALDRADAEFLREKTGEIRELARTATDSILRIGAALIEVKERLGHGQFLPWLESEFQWSRLTAVRFMQVSEAFKCNNLEHLSIDASALYLLAAPSTPVEVRAEVINRAEQGERITHAAVKETLGKLSPAVEKKLDRAINNYIAERTAVEAVRKNEDAPRPSVAEESVSPPPPAPPPIQHVDAIGWVSQGEQTWLGCVRRSLEVLKPDSVPPDRAHALITFSRISLAEINALSNYLKDISI